jgi:hypothetical protein
MVTYRNGKPCLEKEQPRLRYATLGKLHFTKNKISLQGVA